MRRAAVVTAEGIGDGLIMMILSEELRKAGYDVTSFVGRMEGLEEWFPQHLLITGTPELEIFDSFDLIFLQHHNQWIAKELWKRREEGKCDQLIIIYQSHRPGIYPPLRPCDIAYDQNRTMVNNTSCAIAKFLELPPCTANGITPPKQLVFQKYPKRVIIHPTSTYVPKNWLPQRFLQLARKLKKNGFDPLFTVSPEERSEWEAFLNEEIPLLSSLSDLATLIYESGFHVGNDSGSGHLASCLGLPTLTITQSPRHMRLWQPGWGKNIPITPPRFIPNLKGFRMREKFWKETITVQQVYTAFLNRPF